MSNPAYQTIIVGGGFTGLFTALHLSHQHYPRSIILIDSKDRFHFKPLLYEYFSGEMEPNQVVPKYEELLKDSGIIFVQDAVRSIALNNREIQLNSGTCYNYSNLVLAVGSVTGYFGVEGAKEHAFPLRSREDAIAIDRQLRACLQKARETQDPDKRRQLLTVAVIGAGPSGVEMASTLADLLPHWYKELGGNPQDIRIVLLDRDSEILKGDLNDPLRQPATEGLQKRTVPVECILGAQATAIRPDEVEYERGDRTETLATATAIWTTGTQTHPLIKELEVPEEHRDKRGRLKVTPTLQLPDFPEVFAGGDCAAEQAEALPPTAQVAYQQGQAIADNLYAIAFGRDPQPAHVNIRGTLLKLGLEDSAANLFDRVQVTGELGHLIRQGTYLELLPTPIHNLKVTTQWLKDEIFNHHLKPDRTSDKIKWVAGAVIGAVVARKLIKMLGDDEQANPQT